jgi:hypothetical protein
VVCTFTPRPVETDPGALKVPFYHNNDDYDEVLFYHRGSIIGSGTVSNYDRSVGSSCLAEKRMLELLEFGEARTPFLTFGDRVRIEMFDTDGHSIFGAIDQVVEKYEQ